MRSLWKQIDRLYFLRMITVFFQYGEVTCESGGIARDVDDALRLHIGEGLEDGRRAARTRRVHDNDIRTNPLFVECRHDFCRIADDKLCIFDMVIAGILSCIENGRLHDFDAVDLTCSLGKKKGDCPCAAVGINDGLCPMEIRIGKRLFIKAFSLLCIDLKKGSR